MSLGQSPLFAYAGARILARHGRRPAAADWERLERIRDFGHYLQTARDTGLAPFVRHIGGTAGAHELERALRSVWRAYIREVALWQPAPWRPALRWLGVLGELPALAHALAGRPDSPWMAELPVAGPAFRREGPARNRVLTGGPAAPLIAGDNPDGAVLRERWLAHWHRLLPDRPRRFRASLGEPEAAVRDYLAAVSDGEEGADDRLERRLTRILRRHGREPAAAYAHLGLVALDLQRLRRGLLLRRLLPEQAA